MKAEIDGNGRITISLIDVLEHMDADAKQQVIEHFAWQSPIWHELVQGVRSEYASTSLNSKIYEMRLAFFQGDNVPEALRQTIRSLLNAVECLHERERAYTTALGQWHDWWSRNMSMSPRPVPFPDWKTDWAGSDDVRAFLERNGLAGMFEDEVSDAK